MTGLRELMDKGVFSNFPLLAPFWGEEAGRRGAYPGEETEGKGN